MPFSSQKQSAACFASHGFGGNVNCQEWAGKTDYKSLPNKKKPSKKKQGMEAGMQAST